VVDAIGESISVKLDSGTTKDFRADDLRDNNSAG
jgi:hypothetical protein